MAYAARYPNACRGLILRGIWLCRPSDFAWTFDGIRGVHPELWHAFVSHVLPSERKDLLDAYFRRLTDPDPCVHLPAAKAWCAYEAGAQTLVRDLSELEPHESSLALARIEAHYLRNQGFIQSDNLLDGVKRFAHLPGSIVHGRYDMLCFVDAALELADRWPRADFTVVQLAGHSSLEPAITRALIEATNRLRDHLETL